MKLYDAMSANTKRVRIFIAEKEIELPKVTLELGKDTRTSDFRKINPLGEVPALELDDGTVITESLAVCRYLEAAFPDRPLMGVSATDQGRIATWSERIHSQLFMTYGLMVRHSLPLFADVLEQVPAFADAMRRAIPERWRLLESAMAEDTDFIVGDQFSFADVEGMTVLTMADAFDLGIPKTCRRMLRWADAMRDRPSLQA
ncbi:glutathione S-transferase family protein [uncultured Roseobacter sp.]|uniref:glutathione S-transferase family protein n=1 Tax=uncultured Roseobacter sp. TaxID=114847 RepID=UPI00262889D3|nr:glutathione S-transferase family protein [uncultured Roseobacter sp.]